MADPFIGEIRPFAFNFTPAGWLPCNGQQYQVVQYQALASILGNRFGGSWPQTFNVPDLRGRAATNCEGSGTWPLPSVPPSLGLAWGTNAVTLSAAQVPPHTHQAFGVGALANATATGTATATSYLSLLRAANIAYDLWSTDTPSNGALSPQMINSLGGGAGGVAQSHNNNSPYLTFNFCINHDGIYPTQN